MESFTFLKYWRGGANDRAPANGAGLTTVVTAPQETDGESGGEDDDGPFFDLELAMPDEPVQTEPGSTGSDSESGEEEEVALPVSPSEDLFFKGELVPVETGTEPDPEPNAKSQLSRLKSATNLRVLMLKLKRNKEEKKGGKEERVKKGEGKFFTVKFKIEEIPMKSVFKRDNSSRSRTGTKKPESGGDESGTAEEKKVSKDVMQRYLRMVRLPKRHGGEAAVKRLGKSRSAASAEVAPPCVEVAPRRDDSLVQQQDGIQSAILHCKRSFNASRDLEFSALPRSVSDPSNELKSMNTSTKNCPDEHIENDP